MSPQHQQQGISEKIGSVKCADGRSAIAYRALRNLFCSRCGDVIAAAELFTRWAVHRDETVHEDETQNSAPLLAARCRECVPFNFDNVEQASSSILQTSVAVMPETSGVTTQPERSKLIEHLLSSPTNSRITKAAPPMPERFASATPDASHRLVKPESALGITAAESVEIAEDITESVSTTAAEASYNRLAPALNSRNFRAAKHRAAWRSKK